MKTAEEWIWKKYPEVKEEWNLTGHDDNWMCKMMEEYASERIKELILTNEKIASDEREKMAKEFQPTLVRSFDQGMYSGYQFGIDAGIKWYRNKIQEKI